MRNFIVCAVLLASMPLFAVPDIEFSPGGATSGTWIYDGNGTFSFIQMIDIDAVQGGSADPLYRQFVYLPNLTLSSYTSGPFPGMGAGTIAGGGVVEIKDNVGNVLVSGNLLGGSFAAIYATSVLYPEIGMDIVITQVNNTIGSAYLNTLSAGMYFDLNLSIQASTNFDTLIQNHQRGSNGFSGSLTAIIPEPATLVLLTIGGIFLRRR